MEFLKRSDYIHRQLSSKKSGEKFSLSAVISEALKVNDLFIHHEILAPGHRASGPHFHRVVDEVVFVIRGACTVAEGDRRTLAETGDCVSFAAGSGLLHLVENNSAEEVELLVISKNVVEADVVL